VIERASASKFVVFFVIFIFISGSAKAPPIPILIRRHGHARYFSKRVPKISTAGRSARFTPCTIRTSYWEFVSLFLSASVFLQAIHVTPARRSIFDILDI
jgi:hypothetical protein